MKISFIIPYHNEPLWMLHECISSITSLTMDRSDYEVIVVDDGSMISPEPELKQYGDVVCYYHQQNQGPGAARNLGIEKSSCDYLQFVDSDDSLRIEYNQCISIVADKKPDILFFHGKQTSDYYKECNGVEYMLNNNVRGAACCLLLRKESLGKLRYDSCLINEDELFNTQLVLQSNKVIDVGIQAYNYRVRSDSRSRSLSSQRLRQRLDDTETIIMRLHALSETLADDRQRALQRKLSQLTMDYLYNIATQTHSFSELSLRIKRLQQAQLYPLPLKRYTAKYWLFAWFTHVTRICVL